MPVEARLAKMHVVGGQGGAQGTAGVAGRGLYPDAVENILPQDLAVGHAVQGHAAGQAEVLGTGQALGLAGEL